VSLLGRLGLDEMQDWYGHASIYVLPARYEPFGLSALEAASAGCVLVLGNIPSLREVWGDAALFVSPDDEEELARTLLALISDHELRAEYAARALARSQFYTPERMVDGYVRLYGDVLNSRAGKVRRPADCEEVCA
jgi:glycosyltransferase involved in cell wall biosynthesis